MGSRLDSPNNALPDWVVRLLAEQPACFTRDQWEGYLLAVRTEAGADDALRRHFERGGHVRWCEGCTLAHRTAMQAQGRCQPPEPASSRPPSKTRDYA